MTITVQAVGTAASGTGTVSPSWPTHQSGDIGVLLIETYDAAATLDTASGFTLITSTGTDLETHLTAYYCRAESASQAAPVVSDMGDHAHAVIITLRGCVTTGNPVNASATAANVAAVGFTLPSVTTDADNCLILGVVGWGGDTSSNNNFSFDQYPTNDNITGDAIEYSGGTTLGNGGGISVGSATLATAGSTGTLDVGNTLLNNPFSRMTLAFTPETGSGATVFAPAGTMALTGYAPTVANAGPGLVSPPAGTMTLTGYAPEWKTSGIVSAPAGTLTLTGYAPTVEGDVWIQQDDDSQTWTEI